MRDGFRHGRLGEPVTYRTIFGWVLTETAKSEDDTSQDQIENFHIKVKPDTR